MKYLKTLIQTEFTGLISVIITAVLLAIISFCITAISNNSILNPTNTFKIVFIFTAIIGGIVVAIYAAPLHALLIYKSLNKTEHAISIALPAIPLSLLIDPTMIIAVTFCSITIAVFSSLLFNRFFGSNCG